MTERKVSIRRNLEVQKRFDSRERLSSEIKRRKHAEQNLKERLLFEELLSELSARFVNVPSDRVDEEIERALKGVLKFFQVDRCGLLQTLPGKTWRITHVAASEDVPPVPVGVQLTVRKTNPWAYNKLIVKREVLNVSSLDDLPIEAKVDKKTWIGWGIRSNLNIPIIIGKPVAHILYFNSIKRERVWPEELISRLQLLGEIFANALKRRDAEQALRESEARLSLTTEAVGAGLWIMDASTGKVWISPKSRELFHFAPDEEIYYDSYFRIIHAEDRDRVDHEVQRALRSGEKLRCDYRIILPDGTIRWIAARGQPHLKSTGEPERITGLSFDITERKNMELQLSESQTFLNTLIDSTPDLIWSVDAEHFGLLTFNRGLYEYFLNQRGIHIAVGMRPEDLFPSEDFIQKWRSFYQRALDEGSFTTEYLVYAGNRTLRLNLNILKYDDRVFGISVFGQNITELKRMEYQLREQLEEIKKLKSQLEKENIYLREEIKTEHGFDKIIGSSDALQYVLFRVQKVAPTDATVLILGETGVGKGVVAHAIHETSNRRDKPMVTVNCAALPANLIESELFGRERGAFTGAHAKQVGRFEVADRGTIFLDEIGDLPLELQSKLLRVLQDGEFERLGSPKTIKVDVRVIASTSRDLKAEMRSGRFREDLYYRLNVFPVSLPPLRMRGKDIQEIATHYIDKFSQKYGRRFETISKDTMQILQAYHWPGNVRELEHVIERAVITSPETVFRLADQLDHEFVKNEEGTFQGFEMMAREHILQVLQKTSWKIEGEGGAAAILGLKPSTLRFRIKKLGITRP